MSTALAGLAAAAYLVLRHNGGRATPPTMVAAVATRAGGKTVLELTSIICLLLLFFNSGYAPVEQYPGWLQPIVANQPMTPAIEAMRALAAGGPLAENLVKVAVWTVVILVISIYPALRGYRKAARDR